MARPFDTDPSETHRTRSRGFLPVALIGIGVVFLLGNFIPEQGRGGLFVLGLGVAFLLGRLVTGRYGQAVPAGLLIAIGTYISLQELRSPQAIQGPAWFFVLLGLGFVLVYVIGLRPSAVWPLFPGTVLVALGLVLFGFASMGALASLSWIVACWPAALVVLGIWLLFRDRIPSRLQRPLGKVGGLALLAYGILAAAASVAAGGSGLPGGGAALTDTLTLDAPIAGGQAFGVDNSSGSTTIHAGNDASVHVVATRHFASVGQAPDVHLSPGGGGVTLGAANAGGSIPFGGAGWVEYAIEVPANVDVSARSSSGHLDIDGVGGSVKAETSSGALSLSNLGGSADAHSGSGAITLNNVAGDVRVNTSSGHVQATQLRHLREATSSSGSMTLEGIFTDPAQIHASSGAVSLKLLPGSAIQLEATSNSGSVAQQGISLTNSTSSRNRLSGTVGTANSGGTVSIETSSGSILISQ